MCAFCMCFCLYTEEKRQWPRWVGWDVVKCTSSHHPPHLLRRRRLASSFMQNATLFCTYTRIQAHIHTDPNTHYCTNLNSHIRNKAKLKNIFHTSVATHSHRWFCTQCILMGQKQLSTITDLFLLKFSHDLPTAISHENLRIPRKIDWKYNQSAGWICISLTNAISGGFCCNFSVCCTIPLRGIQAIVNAKKCR